MARSRKKPITNHSKPTDSTAESIVSDLPDETLLRHTEEKIRDFLEFLLPSLHCFGMNGELEARLWRTRLGRVPPRAVDVVPVKPIDRCPTTTAQLMLLLFELGAKGDTPTSDQAIRSAANRFDLSLRKVSSIKPSKKTPIAGGDGSINGTPCSVDHLALSLLLTNEEWDAKVKPSGTPVSTEQLLELFTSKHDLRPFSPDQGFQHPVWMHGQWVIDSFERSTDKQHARRLAAFNPWGSMFPALAKWFEKATLSPEDKARVSVRLQAGLCVFTKGLVACDWSRQPKSWDKKFGDEPPTMFQWLPKENFSFSEAEKACGKSRAEDKDRLAAYAREVYSARNAVYVASALSGATRLLELCQQSPVDAGIGYQELYSSLSESSAIIAKAKEHSEAVCNLCVTELVNEEQTDGDDRGHAHFHAMQFWMLARRILTGANNQWKSIAQSGLERWWRSPGTWKSWKNVVDVDASENSGELNRGIRVPVASVETAATMAALAKFESDELCPTSRQGACAWSAAWAVSQVVERLTRDDCFMAVTRADQHHDPKLSDTPTHELPGYVVQRADEPNTSVLKPLVAVAWDNILWARMALMALRLLRINHRHQALSTYCSRLKVANSLAASNQAPSNDDHATWMSRLQNAEETTEFSKTLWDRFVKPALSSKHVYPLVPELRESSVSFILYGPPGSGKTFAVEQLAEAVGWPLITLSPADFIKEGVESLEENATAIFNDLMKLDQAVVFFDECDELFRSRHDGPGTTRNMLSFATASMLPKLQALSKRRRVIFAVATNYLHHIDDAVRREGRFDERLFVDRPHERARASAVAKRLHKSLQLPEHYDELASEHRGAIATIIATLVRASHGCSHTQTLLLVDTVVASMTPSKIGSLGELLNVYSDQCVKIISKILGGVDAVDPGFEASLTPYFAALKRSTRNELQEVLQAVKPRYAKAHIASDFNETVEAPCKAAIDRLNTPSDVAAQSSFDDPPGAIMDYVEWILARSDAEFAAAHLDSKSVRALHRQWQLLPGFAHAAIKSFLKKQAGSVGSSIHITT